jgi:hypothetical protein
MFMSYLLENKHKTYNNIVVIIDEKIKRSGKVKGGFETILRTHFAEGISLMYEEKEDADSDGL